MFGPVDQLSGVAAVGPDQLQTREQSSALALFVELGQHQLGPVAVLKIGCMDNNRNNQPQRVDHDVPLSSADFLASVVTAAPPFSAVFTDCESMMAALGVFSLPASTRTCSRRRSWMFGHTPSSRKRR